MNEEEKKGMKCEKKKDKIKKGGRKEKKQRGRKERRRRHESITGVKVQRRNEIEKN